MSARSRAGSLGLMKARCLYEPARVLFGRWGRLVPRVSFSSDALGMPWEIMGVYIFFREKAPYLVLHRGYKQHVERELTEILPYPVKLLEENTKCGARNLRPKIPTLSQK